MADTSALHRMDLADIHAPTGLGNRLHDLLGTVEGAVPIVEIAKALDVSKVLLDDFDGFEGMLLTDKQRTDGMILANARFGHRRARFTVAHELGHFLLERHVLSDGDGFRCISADLRETREGRQHVRQESEANQFAIAVLAPARMVAPFLTDPPDLRQAMAIRTQLTISLEASLRRMINLFDERLAAIWSHEGRVRYLVKSTGFPFLICEKGYALPKGTAAFRAIASGQRGVTRMVETSPLAWTNRPDTEIWEQTRVGKNGHAVTLLWADLPDEDEDDDRGLPELGLPGFR